MSLTSLSPTESARYARHLMLPQIGVAGQERLKASSVLIIGAGGLGSPAALYLAAAGIGRLGIVDPDTVDLSNLQRQLLHGQSSLGQPKLASASARLAEVNPHVQVEAHPVRLTAANAQAIAASYDLIIDGSDNFPTRFLTNDVAFLLGKPLVYAAIFRFEGQLSVFAPHLGSPCYRCMLPDIPPPGAAPSCNEAGVLGVLPGILGSLQAMEAIKLLLGIGTPPLGKLITYDALQTRFRELRLRRDPDCALCGSQPRITSLDNPQTQAAATCPTTPSIAPAELAAAMAAPDPPMLVDVRQPEEHAAASIPNSILVPLATLPGQLDALPRHTPIILHCKSGVRSARAAVVLASHGFTDLRHLAGGIDAWLAAQQPWT